MATNLGHRLSCDLHLVGHAMDNSAGFLRVFGLIGLGHIK